MEMVWGALLVGILPFLGLLLGFVARPEARTSPAVAKKRRG